MVARRWRERGGNLPAQALYAALGFGAVYGYHCRVA